MLLLQRRDKKQYGSEDQFKCMRDEMDQDKLGQVHYEELWRSVDRSREPPVNEEQSPEDQVHNIIWQAKAAKARMFTATGNNNNLLLLPTAIVNEDYMVVGAHLDNQIVIKIKSVEHMLFGKLIPPDRVINEGRIEMYVKNGRLYWMPASNAININSIARWEQAFWVFSNIYCKVNPHHSAELIEYNHVTHTITLLYTWDNVYVFDKEFRMHMMRSLLKLGYGFAASLVSTS